MFDLDAFLAECQTLIADADPQRAIREALIRALENPGPVSDVLAKNEGGLNVLFNSPELTVLNVIWVPRMTLFPHDHQMWAAIGIYGGSEENSLFRRGPERIQRAGGRLLEEGDVLTLGSDAIHSVTNPERRYTGAIHVYGGDFINEPRSQWDPDTLMEKPFDFEATRKAFAAATEAWAEQLGTDIDESVG